MREATHSRKIRAALATQGISVIAETADPEHALPLLEEREPALLIVELASTGGAADAAGNEHVLDLVQTARKRVPGLNVIAWVESLDPLLLAKAVAKGVDAYVVAPKNS